MKNFFLILMLVLPLAGLAQQPDFPYAKMLSMTPDELKDNKFKYDDDHNSYVLRKSNGLRTASNILSAMNGATADVRPDVNDYQVTIQYGKEGVAYIDVLFYKDETYHELLTFAKDNGANFDQTNSGKIDVVKYNLQEPFSFELSMALQEIKTTTGRTSAAAKTLDESYNVYHYIIRTGIDPDSPWLTKQAQKQQVRDEKGRKKQSVSDLM